MQYGAFYVRFNALTRRREPQQSVECRTRGTVTWQRLVWCYKREEMQNMWINLQSIFGFSQAVIWKKVRTHPKKVWSNPWVVWQPAVQPIKPASQAGIGGLAQCGTIEFVAEMVYTGLLRCSYVRHWRVWWILTQRARCQRRGDLHRTLSVLNGCTYNNKIRRRGRKKLKWMKWANQVSWNEMTGRLKQRVSVCVRFLPPASTLNTSDWSHPPG